ncbi:MAG: Ig-like domain-containing protein [Candidatus Bipolaricaulia bacterium]
MERNGKTVDEDEDDTFFFDDVESWSSFPGLRSFPTCNQSDLNVRVNVPEEAPAAEYYLNVLVDWNHDGRWRGAVRCPGSSDVGDDGLVPEWTVQNAELHAEPYQLAPGFNGLIRLTDVPTGPDMGEMWVRVTVTTEPIDTERFVPVRDGGSGWNGQGRFPFGETEDYFSCLFQESVDRDEGFDPLSSECPDPLEDDDQPIDPPPDQETPRACPADNRAPQTTDRIVNVQSGDSVAFELEATDPDGDALSYRVVEGPINGRLRGTPPELTYEAPDGFRGTDIIKVEVQDSNCGVARMQVFITVDNSPPTATDQEHEIAEDTTLPLTLGGDDPDGDELSCRLVTPPEHGDVVVNEDCSAEYIPDPDFNGEDAFEFEVDDGQGGTDVGRVDITVTPTNDPPVAEDNTGISTDEDTDATIDVLGNDRDVDGDELTITNATDSANGGNVTVNPDGTLTYSPLADFNGTDTFDYTICDPDNACDTATVTLEVTAVNDPPVADDDSATTDEDTPVNVDILDGDTDVDGNVDPSTVQIGTPPSHGQVTVNSDGSVDYVPDPDFNGTDTFTYTVCDDGSPTPIECSNEATVTITVNPVNDPPNVATIPNQTIPEDRTLTVDVSCTDIDGDTLSVAAANLPSGASFVDNGDGTGTLTYAPAFGVVTHPDTERRFSDVEVTCDDGNGGTDTEAFDMTVTDVNRAPQPSDDSASTDEDTDVTIDVLTNDDDPDSEDAIDTTQIPSAPSNGSVVVNADGTVTYTPDSDFNGEDSFVYEVCDDVAAPDQACSTATVSVDVNPVNDPPVASDDTDSTDEDTSVTVPVLDNDNDVDGDSLTITSATQPTNGSVDCSGGTECVYTPNPDFNGQDSFDYTITDNNGEFDTATATIDVAAVNDPPTAGSVDRSMKVNTPNDPQQLNVTLPVSDLDADDTVAADSLNCALSGSEPANGSVSFGPDCTVTYTPDQNYVGPDSFDYEVCDDGTNGPQMCEAATVDVTISNDAPTADSDSLSTDEDTSVDLTLTGSDPNGDPLDFVIESGPSDGTLTCPGDATDVSQLDCTYDPDQNFNGADSFDFSVTDVQGESDTATVTIDVAPVNDPPMAQPDSHTTDEDTSFSLTLVGNDPDTGETLSYAITDGPDFGTLNCSGPSCDYDPDLNVNSTNTPDADAFTFEVCDDGSPQLCDTATHTIDITAVDDAPELTAIADQTIPEGQTLTVNLSCTDVEGDPKTLSVSSSALPTSATFTDNGDGTGSITYTPPFDEVQHPSTQEAFSGITVTCEANGQSDSDDFAITATDVNRAPTADDETTTTDEDSSTTIDVLTGDGDPDSEDVPNLYVNRVTSAPSNGSTTINGDGTITYDPDLNFDGPSDSFGYEVCDDAPGELCTTATVTVNINALNDPPVAEDDSASTLEDNATTVDVIANDSDVDGNIDPGSVQVTSGPSNGTATVNADGSIDYAPDLNFNGSDSFVYEVCDDGTPTPPKCTTATVDVTVSAVNDAPTLTSIPDQEIFEGNTLSFDVACTDVEGDSLTMSASNLPSGVSFVDNGDGTGTFTYSPGFDIVDHPDTPPTSPVDFTGVTTTCEDTANASDSDDFTITVKDTDRAPTANSQSLTLLEDGSTSLQLSGSDVDGDSLTFAIASGPSHGTLSCTLPDCTYVPDEDVNKDLIGGDDQFTFEVDDGFGKTNTGTVNLTILPQEDPPEASNDDGGSIGSDNTETAEDTSVTIDVLANDSDPDGDSLSIIGFTQGSNGSVSCSPSDCDYNPDTNFSGTDSFVYTIEDTSGNTASATVTVTVTPTNDSPSAGNLSFSEPENHTNPQEISFDLPVSDPDLQWEGDSLTCTVTSGPSHGTLDPNSSTDCSPTYGYTPNAGFVGNDSVTYEVCDSSNACASGTVDFTIENLAPEAIRISTETEEDTELPFALAAEDDNNDPLSYEIITPPSHGTLDCPDLTTQPDCTYIPNPDFNGDDSFDYRVTDPHGASDTATANVISVNPINDPPVADDATKTTDEDKAITFALPVSDVDDATSDLSCAQITPQPSRGTVNIDSATCEATYTPDADANGTDEFAYRVTDPDGLSNDALVTINVAAVNDPPSVTWDDADNAISVDENATMTATVTCTDPDQDSFSLSVANAPSGVSFTDNGDGTGTLTYTPGFDVVAHPDSTRLFSDVQVECNDGTSTDSDLLDITVNDVNRAPDAQNDSYSTPQDTQLSVNASNGVIQTNDSDPDGDTLEVSDFDTTSAQGGTVSVDADGSFTYDPPSGFSGTDSFSYTIDDGFGGSDTATVALDVESQTPDAQDQTLATPKNTSLGIDITTSDPNGDPVSYTITSGVSNGSLDCSSIPSCTYTPNTDFVGTDSFQFEACDDDSPQNCDTATVTIDVINQAPNAVDDSPSTSEDTDLNIDVRANDTEPDGDVLSQPTVTSGPSNGTATVESDGTITYSPNLNYNGSDSFSYEICDDDATNQRCDTATVSITITAVDDPPTIDAINDQTTTENAEFSLSVTCTDVDTPAEDLSLTASNLPPENVVFTDLGGGQAELTYTPDFEVVQHPDTQRVFNDVTFTCSDTNASTDELFNLTVDDTNRAPTANDTTIDMNEDRQAPLELSGGDLDGDTLEFEIVSGERPSNGTLTCNNLPNDGGCTYEPDLNYNGSDSFKFRVKDGFGGTDVGTYSFDIAPVNDAPTADPQTTSAIDEDRTSEFTITVSGSDVDGDSLTYSLASGVSHGTLDCANIDVDQTCTYLPDADFNGDDSFTFQVDDGNGETDTATVTIPVSPINDAPTANNVSGDTFQETEVQIDLDVDDVDLDWEGETLSCSTGATAPSNGTASYNDCVLSYTSNDGFVGDETFDYEVCDDGSNGSVRCDQASVTITVNNRQPTAFDLSADLDEDGQVNLTLNGSDPDGDTLTCSLVSGPSNGTATVNSDCTATYEPDTNYNGDDTFDFQVDDGLGGTDTATVSLSITAVNDDPKIQAIADQTTAENSQLTVDVTCTDVDTASSNLTVTAANLPSGANFTANGDGTGTVTYTPSFNVVSHPSSPPTSPVTFTDPLIRCDDGSLNDSEGFQITVSDTNRAPSTSADAYSVDEDNTLNVDAASGVLGNDSDADGDSLSVNTSASDSNSSAGGTVTLSADGSFSYEPPADFNGADSFSYTVEDGFGGSVSETVDITVDPVNDAPSFTAGSDQTVDEDAGAQTVSGWATEISAGPSNESGQTLTFNVSNDNNALFSAQPSIDASGTLSYTPAPDANGSATVTASLSDDGGTSNGGSDTSGDQTFTITVNPVNDAPTASNDSATTDEDNDVTIDVLSNDSDIDGSLDPASVTVTGAPTDGSTTVNGDGSITYSPDQNFNGSDAFSYEVCDDGTPTPAKCATADVDVTVNAVNDAPTASDDSASTDEDTPVTTANVLDKDTDPDGDTLSVSSVDDSSTVGTVTDNGDGTFTYDPNGQFETLAQGETATDSFGYTVVDGNGGTDTATVTVTISGANDAPSSTSIADQTNADGDSVSLDVSANFSDVDGSDTLSYSASGLPSGLSIDASTGVVSGTLASSASQNSPYSVTITADDGNGGSASSSFAWTVTNPAPTASDDSASTDEDTAITTANVLDNDSDPDGDTLNISSFDDSSTQGTVTDNGDGTFTYDPNGQFEDLAQGESDTDSFSYTVQDADGATASATVTITVNGANDAPTSTAISDQTNTEGDSVNLDVSGNFSDPDGSDTLSYSASGLPSGLSIDGATGVISGTIDSGASQNSPFSVTITAEDGNGGSASETFQWTVNSP